MRNKSEIAYKSNKTANNLTPETTKKPRNFSTLSKLMSQKESKKPTKPKTRKSKTGGVNIKKKNNQNTNTTNSKTSKDSTPTNLQVKRRSKRDAQGTPNKYFWRPTDHEKRAFHSNKPFHANDCDDEQNSGHSPLWGFDEENGIIIPCDKNRTLKYFEDRKIRMQGLSHSNDKSEDKNQTNRKHFNLILFPGNKKNSKTSRTSTPTTKAHHKTNSVLKATAQDDSKLKIDKIKGVNLLYKIEKSDAKNKMLVDNSMARLRKKDPKGYVRHFDEHSDEERYKDCIYLGANPRIYFLFQLISTKSWRFPMLIEIANQIVQRLKDEYGTTLKLTVGYSIDLKKFKNTTSPCSTHKTLSFRHKCLVNYSRSLRSKKKLGGKKARTDYKNPARLTSRELLTNKLKKFDKLVLEYSKQIVVFMTDRSIDEKPANTTSSSRVISKLKRADTSAHASHQPHEIVAVSIGENFNSNDKLADLLRDFKVNPRNRLFGFNDLKLANFESTMDNFINLFCANGKIGDKTFKKI
ncbi:hypothetical protein HELRODRAFT_162607 [Helobdella robusta]|uniref:Uncharacterized protein n=1 Tax=Helobdella robusta TaxID=6412 RepID=T1ESX4_HELRO|nr:hypothetical protein HELRODRAFT_162607 [Helobdella robusta]ESN99116.1 hypothetical protein HELRODRAFT_162607 [Helobdella robusta]